MSLVNGVFSFVSGQIAKTGPDAMVINTPVATIGIRGTAGVIKVVLPEGFNPSTLAEARNRLAEFNLDLEVVLLPGSGGTVGEIVFTTFDNQTTVVNVPYQGVRATLGALADAVENNVQTFSADESYVQQNFSGNGLDHLPQGSTDVPPVDGGPQDGTENIPPAEENPEQPTDGETTGQAEGDTPVEADAASRSTGNPFADALLNGTTLQGQTGSDLLDGTGPQQQLLGGGVPGSLGTDPILETFTQILKVNQVVKDFLDELSGRAEEEAQALDEDEDEEDTNPDNLPEATDGVAFARDSQGRLVATLNDGASIDLSGRTDDIVVNSGAGAETIITGSGDDEINSGDGSDTITTNEGNDTVNAGGGADVIVGGVGAGDDTYNGGDGIDQVTYTSATNGVNVDLAAGTAQDATAVNFIGSDTLSGIENIQGSPGNDTLNGDAFANELLGEGGDDTIQGRGGDDTLNGGDGTDTVSYAEDSSGVTVSLLAGTASGAAVGTDSLTNFENITGGSGADTLIGNGGNNVLDGGDGTDTASYTNDSAGVSVSLSAGTATGTGIGSDTLSNIENVTGGSGNDTITGNSGNNALDGGDGTDTISFASETAGITVSLTTGSATGTGIGTDTLANFENIIGGSGDDTFTGNAANNSLDGGGGSDTVSYAGDTSGLTASLADGTASGTGIGSDTLTSIENLIGGSGADTLTGNNSANVLDGGAGDDLLIYTDASDTLTGGNGTDTVQIGNGQSVDLTGAWTPNGSSGLERIDLGAGSNTLTAGSTTDWSSVFSTNLIYITGDSDDTVSGSASWSYVETISDAGLSFDAFALNGVTVAIQSGIALTGLSATSGGSGGGTDSFNGGGSGGVLSSVITGTENADTLSGTDESDTINALGGDDTISGSSGNDTIDGGNDTDTLSYDSDTQGVTVDLSAGTATGNGIGTDSLSNIEGVIGGSGNDSLKGASSTGQLNGGAGNDTLTYSVATVQYIGGDGTDTLAIDNSNTVDLTGSWSASGSGSLEEIDLSNGSTLNVGSVTSWSSFFSNSTIIVHGTSDDTITGGNWTAGNGTTVGGVIYDTFTLNGITLAVHKDITSSSLTTVVTTQNNTTTTLSANETNSGIFNAESGTLDLNGFTFTNSGTFNNNGAFTTQDSGSSPGLFTNTGLYKVDNGITQNIDYRFTSSGTLDVSNGILVLDSDAVGSGGFSVSGAINVASGQSLAITSLGTINPSSFTGGGTLAWDANNNLSIRNSNLSDWDVTLELGNGTLSRNLSPNNTGNWTLNGITNPHGATGIKFGGGTNALVILDTYSKVSSLTINFNNGNEIQNDGTFIVDDSNGTNAGLSFIGGTGISTNNGLISVQAAAGSSNSTTTLNNSTDMINNGTLQLDGLQSGSTFTSSRYLSSGHLTNNGTIVVADSLGGSHGNINNIDVGTLTNNGLIQYSISGTIERNNDADITNSGTIEVSNTNLTIAETATGTTFGVRNTGLINVTDGTITLRNDENFFGEATGTIEIGGTTKSVATLRASNGSLVQDGTVMIDIDGNTAGSTMDRLTLSEGGSTGSIHDSGTYDLRLASGFSYSDGTNYQIVDYTGNTVNLGDVDFIDTDLFTGAIASGNAVVVKPTVTTSDIILVATSSIQSGSSPVASSGAEVYLGSSSNETFGSTADNSSTGGSGADVFLGLGGDDVFQITGNDSGTIPFLYAHGGSGTDRLDVYNNSTSSQFDMTGADGLYKTNSFEIISMAETGLAQTMKLSKAAIEALDNVVSEVNAISSNAFDVTGINSSVIVATTETFGNGTTDTLDLTSDGSNAWATANEFDSFDGNGDGQSESYQSYSNGDSKIFVDANITVVLA
ncbi:MAG: hypothetical protein ACPGOY_00955 [Rhodospirillaceae bacterium]